MNYIREEWREMNSPPLKVWSEKKSFSLDPIAFFSLPIFKGFIQTGGADIVFVTT